MKMNEEQFEKEVFLIINTEIMKRLVKDEYKAIHKVIDLTELHNWSALTRDEKVLIVFGSLLELALGN